MLAWEFGQLALSWEAKQPAAYLAEARIELRDDE